MQISTEFNIVNQPQNLAYADIFWLQNKLFIRIIHKLFDTVIW